MKKVLDTQPYVLLTNAHDKAQNKLTDYMKTSKLILFKKNTEINF